jgi:plastocyanin domain-containing protein
MLAKLIVTVLGIGLIVWVNWYFLLSKKYKRSEEKRRESG